MFKNLSILVLIILSLYLPLSQTSVVSDSDDADVLFDQLDIHTYNIQISQEDLDKLNNNISISTETYYPCNVTVTIKNTTTTLENAGCRYKGHGSIWSCMDQETDKLKISSACRSMSWKVDTNKFADNKQKLHGLKKLNFHGI